MAWVIDAKRHLELKAKYSNNCAACGAVIAIHDVFVWDAKSHLSYCLDCAEMLRFRERSLFGDEG